MIRISCQLARAPKRLFEFDELPVRIGFREDSHVVLDPPDNAGAEIAILRDIDSSLKVQSTRSSGAFQLNGRPIDAILEIVPVKDQIVIGTYVIKVEVYVDPDELRVKMAAEAKAREADEKRKREAAAKKESTAKIEDMTPEKYLKLFFEPVRQYLDDPDVSEIMINGPSSIFIEKKGKVQKIDATFTGEVSLQAAVRNVARYIGRLINKDHPRLDARLPDGSRVHAVIPPLARNGTTVAIRKFRKDRLSPEMLVQFGSLTDPGAKLVELLVRLHKNIIVAGATSSGKTSVLNMLSGFIEPTERILVLEDSSELQLQQDHVVYFETRKPDEHGKGEVTIRDLVHSAMRLRPDRIVVGEIRGGEALDLLQAMNTGHEGSMTTIHANSPVDALSRLETCALLSGVDIPLSALREQVASAIHAVVQTARLFDGSRKITAISEVLGKKDGEYHVQDLYVFDMQGIDKDGKLIGQHRFTGVKTDMEAEAKKRGWSWPAS
jgi:pilus assembly protein CpaF